MKKIHVLTSALVCSLIGFFSFQQANKPKVAIFKNARIALIGNNLGSRMLNYDYFETELQLRYPNDSIFVRNLCDGGDTPGFRPHSARYLPWAFPGAEKFQTEFANTTESEGHFDTHDQWLSNLKTDVVIGFFGFSESFGGVKNLPTFKAELQAFINHTLAKQYNGKTAPKLVLVSPTAYEDISAKIDVPNGKAENANLMLYSAAIKELALKNKIPFVDVFSASKEWYAAQSEDLTIDGLQLNSTGYKIFGEYLANQIFGTQKHISNQDQLVYDAVMEKNWMWHNDYKIPNGVHVYGRRYNPFGPDNYPMEIEKIRQMTAIRDRAIWMAAGEGKSMDVATEDAKTRSLPEVKTNYNPDANGSLTYLSGDAATNSLKMAPGYKIELFASEVEFPDLAKPVQMTFDNKGRLWVACMPSYPHYKPGDSKPNDKIIILEDIDKDGKADKQTIFADKLHVPVGFEISHDGIYVSQGTNLILLKDLNNDDKADTKEIIMSGFDDHDTHHTISAFTADQSGAIVMEEGVFLQTNVETAYGTVRASNGGFYRYNPNRRHLERLAQLAIPNPWGVAFDKFGQDFFAETSSPDMRWMMPGTILPRYGESNPKSKNLIEEAHRVRPTSGLEFIHSRHFPDEVQGDLLINNTIGFLGMKQHQVTEDGTGFKTKFRQDMIVSSDKNFRAVDMEFAPDGSLYVIDWHNILIGHMQHNARDPLRDHMHGRVYRITYPSRPILTPPSIAGASIETLLENLKLPEYRARYATRRELRGRNTEDVLAKIQTWSKKLDTKDSEYEHHILEAMWVSWGLNKIDQNLVRQLLASTDHKIRAAAVRAVRYNAHQIKDAGALLLKAAGDSHGRVRMEAFVAASWMGKTIATPVFLKAKTMTLDEWMKPAYDAAWAHVNGQNAQKVKEIYSTTNIKGKDLELFTLGRTLYAKEGNCVTCHQSTGAGLPASGFPPLAGSKWVTGNKDRLIKLVLKGMMGPLDINGVKYTGDVPMTPYEGLFNDRQMAGVLTYVRNSFGNQATAIQPEDIKKIRALVAGKKDIYNVNELLTEHPLEK
jgi:mono/diheme cytochrome c family protein/glucose/arabinose dehydrogenase